MAIETVRSILAWCSVINIGLLVWWWLFLILAHDFVFRFHGKWFSLSKERFDTIHYSGMLFYKLCIFLFNIVPYIALRIST